jgi:hypothetical protein
LKKRENSQVLTKVFQGLWSKGIRPGDVADELGVTADEMGKMLFGMTFTPEQGGGGRSASYEFKRALSLVR